MSDKIWGPAPPKGRSVTHPPGKAAGNDQLSSAVEHLHWEHPHHVQGEGLQNKGTNRINHPVTSSVYGSK